METSRCRWTLIPWQLSLLRAIFFWHNKNLIKVRFNNHLNSPTFPCIWCQRVIFDKEMLKGTFACFLHEIIVYASKCINLAASRIYLQPYLFLLHNFCMKWKLLISVCAVPADVNILWCIVLANTYIRSISKAYHLPTNGVYSINKCHDHLSCSIHCNNFPSWFSCRHAVQWDGNCVMPHGNEILWTQKGTWKSACGVTLCKTPPRTNSPHNPLPQGLGGLICIMMGDSTSLQGPLPHLADPDVHQPCPVGLLVSGLAPPPEDGMES